MCIFYNKSDSFVVKMAKRRGGNLVIGCCRLRPVVVTSPRWATPGQPRPFRQRDNRLARSRWQPQPQPDFAPILTSSDQGGYSLNMHLIFDLIVILKIGGHCPLSSSNFCLWVRWDCSFYTPHFCKHFLPWILENWVGGCFLNRVKCISIPPAGKSPPWHTWSTVMDCHKSK